MAPPCSPPSAHENQRKGGAGWSRTTVLVHAAHQDAGGAPTTTWTSTSGDDVTVVEHEGPTVDLP